MRIVNVSSKKNFIYIGNNSNNGININLKVNFAKKSGNNNHNYDIFYNMDSNKLKNRIIFCSNFFAAGEKKPIICITQQNINHNIKLIYKELSNNQLDITQPRIIFKKYSLDNPDISFNNKYLFNISGDKISLFNQTFDLADFDNPDLIVPGEKNKLYINYNVYESFNNSDFYKINFNNFLDNNISDIFSYKFKYTNYSNNNNFSDRLNLSHLDNSFAFILDNSSNNEGKWYINTEISNNILIYNINNNLTYIDISYSKTDDVSDKIDRRIYFFINRYKYYLDDNFKNKLILNNKFTYIQGKVIDSNSNFYNNHLISNTGTSNNGLPNTRISNTRNKLYISFGKNIIGLTRRNLFNNFKLNNSKIFIFNNPEFENSITDNYLIDSSYNYSYYNYYETRKYELEFKILEYNMENFYNFIKLNDSVNYYNNNEILNQRNNFIDNDSFNNNYNYNSSQLQIVIQDDNINYQQDNNINLNLRLNDNRSFINPGINLINKNNSNIEFNFKNNYDITFTKHLHLLIKDLSYNLIVGENKIFFSGKFTVKTGSDFKNIDCVFIYHDPDKTTDPSFLFPNNNIQVIKNKDLTIDTLNKVIELNKNIDNVTNAIIIPKKNSSNLSRKQIQGLIGLNKIPQLLSIEPYDENFIIGRGFLNQYNIEDECNSELDKIKIKFNSQKHYSVKKSSNINISTINSKNSIKNLNFSKIVNNNTLSRNIKTNCSNDNNNLKYISNYYTPFKFYKNR